MESEIAGCGYSNHKHPPQDELGHWHPAPIIVVIYCAAVLPDNCYHLCCGFFSRLPDNCCHLLYGVSPVSRVQSVVHVLAKLGST